MGRVRLEKRELFKKGVTNQGCSRGGEYGAPAKIKFLWGEKPPSLYKKIPLPLNKGKGIKGMGSPYPQSKKLVNLHPAN